MAFRFALLLVSVCAAITDAGIVASTCAEIDYDICKTSADEKEEGIVDWTDPNCLLTCH